MSKENLKNSIVLIGPSCVGKSLISNDLSKQTNMKRICIDDLLVMIEYERDGYISKNLQHQKEFAKTVLKELIRDSKQKRNLSDPQLEQKTFELIKEIIDLYNEYVSIFGDLSVFYDIVEKHQLNIPNASMPVEKLENINLFAVDMINKIFELVDEPLIIDAPAPFGWEPTCVDLLEELEMGDLQTHGRVDIKRLNKDMINIVQKAKTVLLLPGEDYGKRNTVRASEENNLLLSNLKDYYNSAKVIITTNGVFNEPENKFLQKRSWVNAEESIEREKLKNKCEINSICNQILNMLEDLEKVQTAE